MKSFFRLFSLSFGEIFPVPEGSSPVTRSERLRNLIICAMLIGLYTVIESLMIETPVGRVNFAFIAIAAIGMLFGPSVGLICGGMCDILGHLVHPDGPFLMLYTLIGALQGLLYGLVLYRRWGNIFDSSRKLRLFGMDVPQMAVRIVAARLIDVLIINMMINTAANIHYGFIPAQSVSAIIAGRVVKNLLELVADLPLILTLLPAVLLAYTRSAGSAAPTGNR
ncbi:MAG: folate family ECF transporter S component [Oscillospiraceae bacterium]|nr:folate family ECF transporter S component [Oscillospiraceae bacterium]